MRYLVACEWSGPSQQMELTPHCWLGGGASGLQSGWRPGWASLDRPPVPGASGRTLGDDQRHLFLGRIGVPILGNSLCFSSIIQDEKSKFSRCSMSRDE